MINKYLIDQYEFTDNLTWKFGKTFLKFESYKNSKIQIKLPKFKETFQIEYSLRRELPKFKESDFKENFNKETFPFLPFPELIQSTRFSNINLQTRLYYKRKVVKTRVIELININNENGTIGKILMNWLKIEFSKWLEKFVIN